jgi:uncharacterized protein YbjQ (UPF0145 family)
MNLGWSGIGCGWYGQTTSMSAVGRGYPSTTPNWGVTPMPRSPVITSGHAGRNSGMKPYVTAVESGWYGALGRLLAEAKALGAHGVVGITITRKHLQNQVWEFTALGTAVRSTDPVIAPRPDGGRVWSTDLSAEDTASAILSGFMPSELILGMSVATKHEDWQMRNQRTSWVNGEVDGLTELIRAARNEARARLESRATHTGGATLVITQMGLQEFESACSGPEGQDSNAEAIFIGTTLVPIPRFLSVGSAKSPVLTVMPLRDSMKGNS